MDLIKNKPGLRQHKYYVYYDGPNVYARMDEQERVLVQTFETPQEAHDYVQSVVNPDARHNSTFGPQGFNSPAFQASISGNCEAVVKKAYGVE